MIDGDQGADQSYQRNDEVKPGGDGLRKQEAGNAEEEAQEYQQHGIPRAVRLQKFEGHHRCQQADARVPAEQAAVAERDACHGEPCQRYQPA